MSFWEQVCDVVKMEIEDFLRGGWRRYAAVLAITVLVLLFAWWRIAHALHHNANADLTATSLLAVSIYAILGWLRRHSQ